MDRDTFENMPMERLAEVRRLVNAVYDEREVCYKKELINNLCKAYNELRCAFPDLGYFPVNPNASKEGFNCAISVPQNIFDKIGYVMSPNWFDAVIKMEVIG